MTDELSELYDMLSIDREEVKKIKKEYESDLSTLMGKVRTYHINSVDISNEYDMESDFERFKVDDISLRYNLNSDAVDYKIALLQGYLNDLLTEKNFNEYRRKKEQELSKNDYLQYLHNQTVKSDKISAWYQEFMDK